MTVKELMDVFDKSRDSTYQKLQVCRKDEDWEDFDEFPSYSEFLTMIYDKKIKCLDGISDGVIRVDIEW